MGACCSQEDGMSRGIIEQQRIARKGDPVQVTSPTKPRPRASVKHSIG